MAKTVKSIENSNLPQEDVCFDEAYAIVCQNYQYQKSRPWTKAELIDAIQEEGSTGNIAYFDGLLYVWDGVVYARKYSPIRCLRIRNAA